jgi:hypothetical protein
MIRASIDAAAAQLQEILDAALRGEEVLVTTKDGDGERVLQLTVTQVEPEAIRKPEFGSGRGTLWRVR